MNRLKTKLDYLYLPHTKKDISIVHISDIHFNINIKASILEKIEKHIASLNPDYIMITGDLIDNPKITKNETKIKELIDFLVALGKITKVIISLGNHDVLYEEDYIFFKEIDRLPNIYILDGISYQDNYIYVAGFTLPNAYYYNITKKEDPKILENYLKEHSKLTDNLPVDIPKIALIHSPVNLVKEDIFNKLKSYDLILTGHTHGGMVPNNLAFIFPGNSGIISPTKGMFPSIAKGKIIKKSDQGDTTIIINNAITRLSLQSGKQLSRLNFVYNGSVNKILIKKKER